MLVRVKLYFKNFLFKKKNLDSYDSSHLMQLFNSLLDKIGKNAQIQMSQNQIPIVNSPSGITSPNNMANSIFTNHQPLAMEVISFLNLHVRFT